MPRTLRRPVARAAAILVAVAAAALVASQPPSDFASLVVGLSEPGGHFDSNNLVSNEKSYLQVIPALRERRRVGGVYLGVGPDQNFTYIAQTRPARAFIVDIRRDNLLLHLLFKALFHVASDRAEYLSLLFGRPVPKPADEWKSADVERIASHIDTTVASPDVVASLRARVDSVIRTFGVPLSSADFATIDRFHRTFIERGLDLKFESLGRPSRPFYPTYRDLLLETDTDGRRSNYLAGEADFQFVRSLQERNLLVPVVCDLAGPSALRAIGRDMRARGERLTAFYTSNVEFYLSNGGGFDRFVANLAELPHDDRSVVIRSVFPNRFGWMSTAPGYYSASLLQPVNDLIEGVSSGRIRGYGDLVLAR